jgi:peroxiredoxin Q/BCP
VILYGFHAGGARALQAGQPAPGFHLPDQDGRTRSLAAYQGWWVVLYFYPRDHTPGCTAEACSLRDALPRLPADDVRILGVSTDPPRRHRAFAARHGLPFPLLADTDGRVARRYDALLALGPFRMARRHTFFISPDGRVARIERNVTPQGHGQLVQDSLAALRGEDG